MYIYISRKSCVLIFSFYSARYVKVERDMYCDGDFSYINTLYIYVSDHRKYTK